MLDNKKDDDNDGVADVDQIDKQQLMTRKISLVLKTVNPNRVLEAWGGLAQAFAGVCATLKLQFARVISLAVSIADQIRPVLVQFVAPALVQIMPSDYHHWIFPMIDVASKLIGGSIAWFLFRVLAAVHSGIIGGLACARALMRYANSQKWITLNHEETMLDEYAGWALAAVGVYFQVLPPHPETQRTLVCVHAHTRTDMHTCAHTHIRTHTQTRTQHPVGTDRRQILTTYMYRCPTACQRPSLSTSSSCPSPPARVTYRYLLTCLAVFPTTQLQTLARFLSRVRTCARSHNPTPRILPSLFSCSVCGLASDLNSRCTCRG